MLTKNDLQQIREVLKGEILNESPKIVEKALKPVKRKLDTLYKDFHAFVDYLDKRLTKVEKEVKVLQTQ